MRIKLLNQGYHRHPYYWFIAQPIYKKLNGRHLEKLGVWAPVRKKTVPRQISINQHRMRYWLSVGATPTPGAQNLLEKYGFVPKAPRPFGQEHAYHKPEKVYKELFYTPLKAKILKSNKLAIHYRAKL
jgi:small subunit ribosomal protein S16